MAAGSPDRLAALREGWARLFPPRPAIDATVPRRVPGWRVIAAKELTDHVTSVRFLVLLVILALAAGEFAHKNRPEQDQTCDGEGESAYSHQFAANIEESIRNGNRPIKHP